MKFERISENVIKITVSPRDLAERNIDIQSLTYNSAAAQELFWEMMEQAENKYGFDFSNSHIVLEPMEDIRKGFIITVTKIDIDEDPDFEFLHNFLVNKFRKSDYRVKKKTRKILVPARILYSFKSLDDVVEFAKILKPEFEGESYLYKLNNTYYLLLRSLKPFNYNRVEHLLNEYGRKISNISFLEGYLNEYGELLIEKKALKILKTYLG
ncbi:MAG TPA: adaptor protein MecA [Clostridiaceae bacterium]|nr:adaptor protein MecA [Clostridiaceae bacterium]